MIRHGWASGHLLIRTRHNYGLAGTAAIEALASGCSGLWTGASDLGPQTGYLASLVALVILAIDRFFIRNVGPVRRTFGQR